MIYLGSDHKGFAMKEKIKLWLAEFGNEFESLSLSSGECGRTLSKVDVSETDVA